MTLHGSNLSGATLAVSGKAVTISGASASASQINATLNNATSAATGPVILTATTSGGLSNGLIFNIDPALAADFTVSAAPASRTVTAGASASYDADHRSGERVQRQRRVRHRRTARGCQRIVQPGHGDRRRVDNPDVIHYQRYAGWNLPADG